MSDTTSLKPAENEGAKLGVRRLALVVAGLAYLAVLWRVFVTLLVPWFAYERAQISDLSLPLTCFNYAIAALPLLWMPTRLTRPSQIIYFCLWLLVYAPTQVFIHHYLDQREPGEIVLFQFALAGAFLITGLCYWSRRLPIPIPRIKSLAYWSVIAVVGFAMLAHVAIGLGLELRALSLFDVYDVREEFSQDVTRFVAYSFGWLANVIVPLVFAYGLVRRSVPIALLAVAIQLLLYMQSGSKSFLFGLGFLAVSLLAMQGRAKLFGAKFVAITTGGVALGALIDTLMGSFLVTAFGARRAIYVPGQLTSYYYDFFVDRTPAMLGDSTLRSVVDYPYDLPVPFLIAREYFGRPTMMANANAYADGFAHFGYVGLFLAAFALMVVLWVYDSVSRGKDLRITSLVAVIPAVSLCNSSVQTSLVTHGIAFAILALWLFPREAKTRTAVPIAIAEPRLT
jgi:hypothetical protein